MRRGARSLHVKLTGAMLAVLVLDGAGYLLAVTNLRAGDENLATLCADIFVTVALLTLTVGLILPGSIGHAAGRSPMRRTVLPRGRWPTSARRWSVSPAVTSPAAVARRHHAGASDDARRTRRDGQQLQHDAGRDRSSRLGARQSACPTPAEPGPPRGPCISRPAHRPGQPTFFADRVTHALARLERRTSNAPSCSSTSTTSRP